MRTFFTYRIPVYYTFISSILLAGFIIYLLFQIKWNKELAASAENISPVYSTAHIDIKRLGGYSYIAPLMFVDNSEKSNKFETLTQNISTYINQRKQTNELINASYYIREVSSLDWGGYNEDEKYWPGSLMKVPILISYLRLAEQDNSLFQKKLFYKEPYIPGLSPEILSKQIEPGNYYTVKELLNYMISHSDNNAATLLDVNLDQNIFNKVLTDMGLQLPEKGARHYPISAKEYSLFMRAIYNASYLTIAHSEYAAELLSTTDFKNGFSKGFPPSIKMIHKFGESGTPIEHQLSESGIVYINNKSYVLTVMTKGKDLSKLSTVIAEIAEKVYQQVSTL